MLPDYINLENLLNNFEEHKKLLVKSIIMYPNDEEFLCNGLSCMQCMMIDTGDCKFRTLEDKYNLLEEIFGKSINLEEENERKEDI